MIKLKSLILESIKLNNKEQISKINTFDDLIKLFDSIIDFKQHREKPSKSSKLFTTDYDDVYWIPWDDFKQHIRWTTKDIKILNKKLDNKKGNIRFVDNRGDVGTVGGKGNVIVSVPPK